MKMKNEQLLRSFEYSTVGLKRSSRGVVVHGRLVEAKIDFQMGKLYLQGNRQYLLNSNIDQEDPCLGYYQKPIKVNLRIYPRGTINLEDFENDGNVLFLQGSMKDECQSTHCTGMLILTRNVLRVNNSSCHWFLIVYLYTYNNAFIELKFTFPLYMDKLVRPLNFISPC